MPENKITIDINIDEKLQEIFKKIFEAIVEVGVKTINVSDEVDKMRKQQKTFGKTLGNVSKEITEFHKWRKEELSAKRHIE